MFRGKMLKKILSLICMLVSVQSWAQTVNEIRPMGDYATINVRKDMEIMELLSNDKVSKKEKLVVVQEIEENAGDFNPAVLASLSCYYLSNKDLKKGAFWARAALFRTIVDVKIHYDPSIEGISRMFYRGIAETGNKVIKTKAEQAKFISELKFAGAKIIDWDKRTPRNYDDRWVCLHSTKAFIETEIKNVSQEEKQKIIDKEYSILAEVCKSEADLYPGL